MGDGAIKLKPELNQGFAIVSPDEARLYSESRSEAGDVFLQLEGGETCRMPDNLVRFPAIFRGQVQVGNVEGFTPKIPTKAVIPDEHIEVVARGFNLKPEKLREILANMGPGQKYDLLAKASLRARIAEHLMVSGGQLAVTLGSLLGVGELVDMAGIKDPALSFILVIKGAELVSIPVEVTMGHLYEQLKRPFDLVLKGVVVRNAAGEVAGELLTKLPVNIGLGNKLAGALWRQIVPEGASVAAKIGNIATWPAKLLIGVGTSELEYKLAGRHTFGFGEGLVFSNLYDAFAKEFVKENLGQWWADKGGFLAFFTPRVGGFLTFGYFTKLLKFPLTRIVLEPAAASAALTFADMLADSFIFAPLQYGKRGANYMTTVSMRAADELSRNNWNWLGRGLGVVVGEGVMGHLCSGRGLGGFAAATGDYIGVSLGFKSRYDTCAYAREVVESQDVLSMRGMSAALKYQFKAALLFDGTGDVSDIAVWKARIENGWFDWVDISAVQATNSRLFDVNIFQWLEAVKIYDTPEANQIIPFLSKEFMEYENDFAEEDEKRDITRIPMDMTLIPGDKRAEFLTWLGGEEAILSDRRMDFTLKLLWVYMRQVAGNKTPEDTALLELGKEAGFLVTRKGGSSETEEYDFVRTGEYYKALAEIVRRAAIEYDLSVMGQLQAYSEQRKRIIKDIFTSTNGGIDKEAMAAAPYVRDLQILDPVLIMPGNSLAPQSQEYFIDRYVDRLPRDTEFIDTMNEYARIWESYIKMKIGGNIAARRVLGLEDTSNCGFDTECVERSYAETQFNSLKYIAEDELGIKNDLEGSSAMIDRSVVGLPIFIKAFANYAVLGSEAPEAISKGVISEDGRLLDAGRFAAWVAEPARQFYDLITVSNKFAPEDRKDWMNMMVQNLEPKLENIRQLLARKWLMAVIEGATLPGRDLKGMINWFISKQEDIEIKREMVAIAAIYKNFKKEINERQKGLSGVFAPLDPEFKKAEAILNLLETGIIAPDGQLGELSAIEAWIKDDIISAAGNFLIQYQKNAGKYEQQKKLVEGKLEMGRQLRTIYVAESERRTKGKEDTGDIDAKIQKLDDAIKNLEDQYREINAPEAIEAEVARLKKK